MRLVARMIPEGSKEIKSGSVTAYVYNNAQGQPCVKAFVGKSGKPSMNFRYRDEAARDKSLAKFIEDRAACDQYKAERAERAKVERKAAASNVKIGDVFVDSWGYDQTNIDYYQVIEVKGCSVVVREIASDRVETGFMSGRCVPAVGEFIGEPMKKRLNGYGFRVNSFSSARQLAYNEVDGKKVYESNYWSSYA